MGVSIPRPITHRPSAAPPSSLLWDWRRVFRLVIARGGGRDLMRPITRCSVVVG